MKKANDEILWGDIEWMGGESPLIKSAPSKAKIITLDETNTSLEILDCLIASIDIKNKEDLMKTTGKELLKNIPEKGQNFLIAHEGSYIPFKVQEVIKIQDDLLIIKGTNGEILDVNNDRILVIKI